MDFAGPTKSSKSPIESEKLGNGVVVRRYVRLVNKNTGESAFHIDRLWQWNGAKFVRIRVEPPLYRLPPAIVRYLVNRKLAYYAPEQRGHGS